MNDLIFARVGGLSSVYYDRRKFQGFAADFHRPPRSKGIYAYLWPYIDLYLALWSDENRKEFEVRGIRKFKFDGYLWCHLDLKIPRAVNEDGTWTQMHTDEYVKVLKVNKHTDTRYLLKRDEEYRGRGNAFQPIHDPYKRGLGGWMSTDHLEVFIDSTQIGRIR